MMRSGIGAQFGTANLDQPQLAAGGGMIPLYGAWPYSSGPGAWASAPPQQLSPFDRLGPPQ